MSPVDGQLLERYAAERSEAAFEALVERHGRMVLGVCERLLKDSHDAEDAFQATFLVLARGPAKLRRSDSVASWLHGVALRIGLNAKRQAAVRREHERRVAEMTETESETAWRDLGPVLDEELGRLPERLRAPVVLCYLQSKSTKEAAKELGWTHGALRGRLAKARDLLRGRLSRRGIVIGAALLASIISENASAAAVPPACIASTVQAATALSAGGALASAGLSSEAAALAEGALRGMFLAKVKAVAGVVVAGACLLVGATFVATELSSREEPVPTAAPEEPAAPVPPQVDRGEPAEPGQEALAAQEVAPGVRLPGPAIVPKGKRAGRAELKRRLAARRLAGEDLPEAVLQSLLAFRPGAAIEEVKRRTKGGQTVYKVDLEADGRDIEVELGADGTIRRTKEEIDVAEVPQAVADAVAQLYPRATVNEVEKRTRGDETTFEVELEIDGETFDVELTPDGEVIEDEKADGQDEDEHEDEVDDGDERGVMEEGDNVNPADGAGSEVF